MHQKEANQPRPWFHGFLALTALAVFMGCSGPVAAPVRPLPEADQAAMAGRLQAHVRMLSRTLAPREIGHPDNLDRVAGYLEAHLKEAGAKVSEQAFTVAGKVYRNVVAHFGREDGPLMVVGAHYDTCEEHPGADDNASGIAGLLELAKRLHQTVKEKGPAVDLVAYTLEEPPAFRTENMGSAHHARALKEAGRDVKAMIALEMIGYYSSAPRSQDYPISLLKLFYPAQGDFIAVVGDWSGFGLTRRVKKALGADPGMKVRSINAPRWVPGIDFSDHLNYWKEGFPAVMVTDTAFYRNKAYHTAEDTPDRLDYMRMALVVEGVARAVERLGR
jgi:Zn-dependent M28 family amino/carboxypeptidase